MNIVKSTIISILLFAFHVHSIAQSTDFLAASRGESGLRIMFYNVENLFDTFDDPSTNDEEFTRDGEKSWSYYRYKKKLNNIAKTIIAVGGWEPPDIIGLCEIENFQVLLDLTTETPLKKFGYQIIHDNSMDRRGIDNALIYLPGKLRKMHQQSIKIPTQNQYTTRDILYASFAFQETDTISLYVNHWPSRYGGKMFSEERRLLAASTLRSHADSILTINTASKLLVIVDFNDEPSDRSINEILNAKEVESLTENYDLYNLSFPDYNQGEGTLVYKEIDYTWFLFDQIIVTPSLLNGYGLTVKGMKSNIFKAEWLMENGRPYRTYQGPIYKGGFSDHLPIFIDLYYKD